MLLRKNQLQKERIKKDQDQGQDLKAKKKKNQMEHQKLLLQKVTNLLHLKSKVVLAQNREPKKL